jgi:hypothetical protein
LGKTSRREIEDMPIFEEINEKIKRAREALKSIDYVTENVSAQEFHDYMTGEIFSEDPTTLADVLGNEYIMVHELAEISELKKMGRHIDKRVIVDSPKTVIYEAHFNAIELELNYALFKSDYYWVKVRLKQHRESVLEDDPNLPEMLRPRGEEILKKFSALVTGKSISKA